MNSVCAKPAAVFGTVTCQRRVCVRAVAAVSAPPPPARVATMYEVLAVMETAGPEEIKAAYRRAARRWHPDACPGGAERFMQAREAYEVLSDPARRRGYDLELHGGGGAAGGVRGVAFGAWEAQLAGLQRRAAARRARADGETWGCRMRRVGGRK